MSGETKSVGQKHNLDKFYTKISIVEQCLSLLDLSKYDLIIEPSAGNGSFSKKMNCIAFDLEPEADSIIKADWFKVDKTKYSGKILIIGNPPFGQQNTLSVSFFNESAKIADTIAFILPLSFKKISLQNRLDLNFSLKEELILPENSFILNEEEYSVPCVFQIWERGIIRKKVNLPITSNLIDFTKDSLNADFRVPRVGGNASKASLNLNGALQSNYFIINKTNFSNEELVNIINKINFPSISFTVGPKSLSKGEFIYELETYIKENY